MASLQNHMKAFKLGHKEFEKKFAEKDSKKKMEQKIGETLPSSGGILIQSN